jgi:site-specific recombinase XerD
VLAAQFIPLGSQHIRFHDALLGGHETAAFQRRFVMKQTHCPTSEKLQLGRLVADALVEIERLGYSRRSRTRYRATWEHLVEFSRRKELGDEFSADLASRFLEEYGVRDEQVDEPGWRRHMVFGVKVLADFAKNGRIERAITEVQAIHLLPTMQNTLRDYEQYCKDRLHLRPSTLRLRTTELTIFLGFLHSRRARTLDQIQAADLSEFVSCRDHLQAATVARIVSDVRSFLRFLTMRGILQKDLSAELPKIRVPRDATIPSVWDHELIVRLLGGVDRSSAKGKRDYAILLLACRLGLRAGDIRMLKLDNLRWVDSTIEITQAKTGTPLSLPMTSEVGEALIDYLKSGRPQTTHREVFLKVNPPFDPFTENNHLYNIVTYWRLLAKITFRSSQKRGIHSLRHTLATRLLEKGTPFTTIAEILGHTSVESTRIYAKANVEALRGVALDPEGVNHVD